MHLVAVLVARICGRSNLREAGFVWAHGFGGIIKPSGSERHGVTWYLVVGGCNMGSSHPDESGSRDETGNRAGL